MRVNEKINKFSEVIALLLSLASTSKAVAEQSGFILWTQTTEVLSQLNIRFSHIPLPEIIQKFIYLYLIHPQRLSQSLFQFLLWKIFLITIFPYAFKSFAQLLG